jgi:hypothetical protein
MKKLLCLLALLFATAAYGQPPLLVQYAPGVA